MRTRMSDLSLMLQAFGETRTHIVWFSRERRHGGVLEKYGEATFSRFACCQHAYASVIAKSARNGRCDAEDAADEIRRDSKNNGLSSKCLNIICGGGIWRLLGKARGGKGLAPCHLKPQYTEWLCHSHLHCQTNSTYKLIPFSILDSYQVCQLHSLPVGNVNTLPWFQFPPKPSPRLLFSFVSAFRRRPQHQRQIRVCTAG